MNDRAVSLLKKSQSVLFITGAGISAESGLPTYRGIGGLYNNDETEEGMPIETLLSGEVFKSRPEVSWKYIFQIEKNCRGAKFNRAHEIIAKMQDKFKRVWVLTQNVDGFHLDAGSKNVIEIHGNIHRLCCTSCDWFERVKDYSHLTEIPPKCSQCNNVVRPDVVLFGEMLPIDKLNLFATEFNRGFDICFSVGTTSLFPYISMPVLDMKRQGRPTIEINPGETDISQIVDIKLNSGAVSALEAIWKGL